MTFLRKSRVESDAILQAASNMEPRIARAFMRAVERIKGTVSMDKLIDALAAHDDNGVMAVLAIDKNFADALAGRGIAAGVESFRDSLHAAFSAGADAAINKLPSTISTELSFNLMSQTAADHLAAYDFNLIQQISADTKEAIRGVIQRAFAEGGSPAEQAREIRDVIGLTARQEQAVANFRSYLETGDIRTALDRALRDGRYDKTLLRSLQSGSKLNQERVDGMVQRYNQRFVNYRAETIARTESIRASNKGQQEAWRQAQAQGLLPSKQLRVWITSGDDATCEICADLDGETAMIGEEFDDGIMEPPDPHPNCRCTTGLEI